ncbi:MAG: FlgD immunoglobulin-like domain containing protein, partial [bacterium]
HGNDHGQVYAYDNEGQILPGWPWNNGYDNPVGVSIRAIAAPYPLSVIACVRNRVYFMNYAGRHISHLGSYASPAASSASRLPSATSRLRWWPAETSSTPSCRTPAPYLYQRELPDNVSDAVTLGDFDLDGDVEALAPTEFGELYLLDDEGNDYSGGWPFASVAGYPLTSAAIASNLGGLEPELAVASRYYTVHLLWADGGEQSGYPVYTGTGWWILGAPIINRVEGYYADVILGARDTQGWAWDNFGQVIHGWPEPFTDAVHLSAASGDLDLDGSTEIVFLTRSQMAVIDIHSPPNADYQRWAMYAHDPQRTGCSDCPEDLVTGIGDGDDPALDADRVTRVSFAPPQPNPISGTAIFNYAVPTRARVRLEIYDLRGHLVRTVLKTEIDTGHHLVAWDGRGADGRQVASGQYIARLRVRGQDVREDMTRKITVLRYTLRGGVTPTPAIPEGSTRDSPDNSVRSYPIVCYTPPRSLRIANP